MHPSPPPPAATPDCQDLVNMLLAAAVQADAALTDTHRNLQRAAGHPQAAADLSDAAAALSQVRDALLHAADELTVLTESRPAHR